jgi:hypothetical protein
MEDQEINWDKEETQEESPKNMIDAIQEIADQIDQKFQYIYDYLQRALSSGDENYNKINEIYNSAVKEYEEIRNAAIKMQSENVDQSEIQETCDRLMLINEYVDGIINKIDNPESNGQTEIVASGATTDVITMEEAGPIRAWWSGLSGNTKLIIKAALIGFGFFVGKKIIDKAIENIKLNHVEETRKKLLEEEEEEEEEDIKQ